MTLFYYTGGGRGGRGGGGFGGGDRRGGRDDSRGGAGGGNQGKLEARAGDWDCSSYVLFVLQTVTLKIFSCFCHAIRSNTKTRICYLAHKVFLSYAMPTCICFKLQVVHRIACVLCGWPDWLLWVYVFFQTLNT